MRRIILAISVGLSLTAPSMLRAQSDGGYQLVPNWPKLPSGLYFGLQQPPPPPAEREALAAARRARGTPPASGAAGGNDGPRLNA